MQVRSVAASGLKGNWNTARTFTVNVYDYNAADSNFIYTEKYISANNSVDTAGQVKVPAQATAVNFTVTGVNNSTVVSNIAGVEHSQTGQWPHPTTGAKQFKFTQALPAGEYKVTAQYLVNGIWHNIVTNSPQKLFVLGQDPILNVVNPNDGRKFFRAGESDIVKVRVSDPGKVFSDVRFQINGATYTVYRDQCDLRQEGNYVLCDVTKAANWPQLAEGNYTATVTAYDKARNNATKTTQEFTIDNTTPVVVDFTVTPTVVAKKVTVSAKATDNNDVKSVKFYVTARDTDGTCKNNLPTLTDLAGRTKVVTDHTDNVYKAELDTSGLNGNYCVLVSAQDVAMHNSVPQFKAIVADNTAPTGTVTYQGGVNYEGTQYVKSIDELKFTEVMKDALGVVRSTYLVQKFDIAQNKFIGVCGNWNANSSGSRVHSGAPEETSTVDNVRNCAPTNAWGDGRYKIFHAAYDAAGNEGKYNTVRHEFVIDSTLPNDVSITLDRAINPTEVQIAAKDANLNRIDVSLRDMGGNVIKIGGDIVFPGEWVSPVGTDFNQNYASSLRLSELPDGEYEVRATAGDAAGNSKNAESKRFTIDRTPPVVTLDTIGTVIEGENTVISGKVTDANLGETVVIEVNGNEHTVNLSEGKFTLTIPTGKDKLPAGSHAVKVKSTDKAGNTGEATPTATAVVNLAAPTINSIDPVTVGSLVVVTGTGVAGDSIAVKLGDKTQSTEVGVNGIWEVSFGGVSAGTHSVTAVASRGTEVSLTSVSSAPQEAVVNAMTVTPNPETPSVLPATPGISSPLVTNPQSPLAATPFATIIGGTDAADAEDDTPTAAVRGATDSTSEDESKKEVLAAKDSKEDWSLVNLILTILIVGLGAAGIRKLAATDKEQRKLTGVVLAGLVAVGSVVALLMVENFTGNMIWFNTWSLLLGGLAVAQVAIISMIRPAGE